MARRRKKGNLTPVGEIAQGVLGNKLWKKAEAQAIVEKVWNDVVGESVAKHSQVSGIKGGHLVVLVDDHSLMNNLQLMTPGILKRINDETRSNIRPFNRLVLRWGEIDRNDSDPKRAESDPILSPEQQERVDEVVGEIKDPELREITKRVISRVVSKGSREE